MKVPPQYTIAGLVVLCSVIHYYTKYQMYESVSAAPQLPSGSSAESWHAHALSREFCTHACVVPLMHEVMWMQAMRGIRQSPKYRARLKELLEEQESTTASRPLSKGRRHGSRARK